MWDYESRIRLEESCLNIINNYEIQSINLTMLCMVRQRLITKEKVQETELSMESIYDDLENFFNKLKDGVKIESEIVRSSFTPQLTDKEMKLVEEINPRYLRTYSDYYYEQNPDVEATEMKNSGSESKFVRGRCFRSSIFLTAEQNRVKDETSYKAKMEYCNIL